MSCLSSCSGRRSLCRCLLLRCQLPLGHSLRILQRAKAMHADICDEKREAMRTYEVLRRYQLAVSGGDSSGELSAQR